MGRDLIIRTEKTRTPVKVHGTQRPFSLEFGPAIDMGKFFDFSENLSAVALKSGKIVY